MSLFNARRDAVGAAPAASWWSWNPYRRTVAPGVAATPAARDPTWRRNPFRRDDRVATDARQAAYVDGARDERRAETEVESRAYRTGERDGRRIEARRHRGHPVLASLVFLIALAGVGYGYLSYEQGSFAAGGAVIDEKIAQVRGDAGQAGVASGQAVQNAGADITAHSQALTQSSGAQTSGDQTSGGQATGG